MGKQAITMTLVAVGSIGLAMIGSFTGYFSGMARNKGIAAELCRIKFGLMRIKIDCERWKMYAKLISGTWLDFDKRYLSEHCEYKRDALGKPEGFVCHAPMLDYILGQKLFVNTFGGMISQMMPGNKPDFVWSTLFWTSAFIIIFMLLAFVSLVVGSIYLYGYGFKSYKKTYRDSATMFFAVSVMLLFIAILSWVPAMIAFETNVIGDSLPFAGLFAADTGLLPGMGFWMLVFAMLLNAMLFIISPSWPSRKGEFVREERKMDEEYRRIVNAGVLNTADSSSSSSSDSSSSDSDDEKAKKKKTGPRQAALKTGGAQGNVWRPAAAPSMRAGAAQQPPYGVRQ